MSTEDYNSLYTCTQETLGLRGQNVINLPNLKREKGKYVLHMFHPDKPDISYDPGPGYTPNWFVRLCFRVFFNCYWVKQ